MKALLDTNVLLDFLLDSRGGFHAPAVELMKHVACDDVAAFVTSAQLTDLHYCLRKAVGKQGARTTLRDMLLLVDVVDTTAAACMKALESPMVDFEDAVQAFSALEAGCDCIITRNVRDFREAPLPAWEPAVVLERLGGRR